MRDLDAAHEVLSAAYAKLRLSSTGRRASLRLASRTLGAVRFDELDCRIGFEADCEPSDGYIFGQLACGRVVYSSDGEDRFVRGGDAFLAAPPGRPFTAVTGNLHASIVVFGQAVVDEVVDDVRFVGCRPVSARAAAVWRATSLHLRDGILPAFAGNSLVLANATRLLVATTLATFPHATVSRSKVWDRSDAHPRTLRRAIMFIESNAAMDITAADIARAARVSIRAIQLAFRRHLDTTPMAYLRSVRMSCAHTDLLAANGSVTEIAARWGYARPSVFAAHYRAAYGVPPSRTLWSG
ncbi:AraC-type DNA-binding protein [Lentzea fradiae]|uniref:AraC-type DNA-binding protein n=1 Tax=Lentzea fradiae TaxID=200378 RepID=A0A1G7P2V1_9PSEU|nr:AraC-type DNA-binding protein [Lentzea fradiae]